MTNQTVGYIRVSHESQNIDRQLAGIKLDREFVDKMNGGTKARENLEACMQYVRDGDTLVVDSIDRLARNLRDLQDIVSSLVEKGVTVKFIKESLTFNSKSDPMANLTLQMMGAFAEFERTLIRARQREGIEAAKRAGRTGGRPAKVTPKLVADAKAMIEDGASIRNTALKLKVSRMTIYKVLGRYATKTAWSFDKDTLNDKKIDK